MAIASVHCSFCGHDNPAAAKYCNECAADLQLALCSACSAVNRRDMAQCHKCGASLHATSQESATLPAVAETAPEPSPPPRHRRVIAFALMAVIGVIAAASAAYRMGAIAPAAFTAPVPAEAISHASDASRAEPTGATVATPATPPRDEPAPPRDEPAPPRDEPAPPRDEPEPRPDQRIEAQPTQAMALPKDPEPMQPPTATAPPTNGCTDAVAALALCDRSPAR